MTFSLYVDDIWSKVMKSASRNKLPLRIDRKSASSELLLAEFVQFELLWDHDVEAFSFNDLGKLEQLS